MQKRHFLQTAGMFAVVAATGRLAAQTIKHNPFTLGVASGSPSLDGFVLWTRLLPAPQGEPLPSAAIEVQWDVALDDQFVRIVQTGSSLALPEFAHSVHVELKGLRASNRLYWYRFRVADAISTVGRTRTLPPSDSTEPMRVALASCQNYEHGYFGAYRHMAAENIDCVLFVGDYIYEYGITPNRVRQHNSATCTTLEAYRARYALYKSDPDLQLAHASFPWIVTWDDHEVENDYAHDRAASGRGAEFLKRRAAAYQAYWEHQPLRLAQMPNGANMQLYRRYLWGQTANLHVLDARQYRDHQVCTPPDQGGSRTIFDASCPERLDPRWSLLGAQQEAWLDKGIRKSTTAFNVVAQQSIMAQMRMTTPRAPDPQPAEGFWNDAWDGYPAARQRALETWKEKKNVISLGGDVHATYVTDLKAEFDGAPSPVLATEFVGTSISSPSWSQAVTERVMRNNPHIKFGKSDQRGYTVLHVASQKVTVHMRVIDNARIQTPSVSTAASFEVEVGKPGARPI